MKFIADKSYWELFPNSKLGVLLLKKYGKWRKHQ